MAITTQLKLQCIKHPNYSGKRAPKFECKDCQAIHALRQHPAKFVVETFGEGVKVTLVILDV